MLRIGYICDINLVSNRGTDEQSSIPPQIEAGWIVKTLHISRMTIWPKLKEA